MSFWPILTVLWQILHFCLGFGADTALWLGISYRYCTLPWFHSAFLDGQQNKKPNNSGNFSSTNIKFYQIEENMPHFWLVKKKKKIEKMQILHFAFVGQLSHIVRKVSEVCFFYTLLFLPLLCSPGFWKESKHMYCCWINLKNWLTCDVYFGGKYGSWNSL